MNLAYRAAIPPSGHETLYAGEMAQYETSSQHHEKSRAEKEGENVDEDANDDPSDGLTPKPTSIFDKKQLQKRLLHFGPQRANSDAVGKKRKVAGEPPPPSFFPNFHSNFAADPAIVSREHHVKLLPRRFVFWKRQDRGDDLVLAKRQ